MDSFESKAYRCGFTVIAGIDEAGRGPLAGPVVAAAVVLPRGYKNGEVRDSKQLTPRVRARLYEVITRDALSIGLGVTEPSVIDRVNILRATLMAMREAVTGSFLQ
ncbi:MAG: ribonuclease HII, partial [Deltaproteobacteria bacterium]|nr:ribonuclease HII [Deltaproteobacteria bacterium]